MLELEANEAAGHTIDEDEEQNEMDDEPKVPWNVMFKEQRKQIIELWDLCFVSIIHRTQFYLLFKGEPADQIYMEVELRRLNWLQQHLSEHGNATPAHGGDEPMVSISSRYVLLPHILLLVLHNPLDQYISINIGTRDTILPLF